MNIGGFQANAKVHDPFLFSEQKGVYYLFGTHMTAAKSKDLRHWEQLHEEDVSPKNTLFDGLFESHAFDFCGKFNDKWYAVWAPDVSYNPYLKKYVMYFSVTGSYIKSSIAMATADQVEGPYRFERVIVSSGFTRETVAKSNVLDVLGRDADISRYLKRNGNYNNFAYPNCIDPNTFHDRDGRLWMVYGSWSGGVFLLELNPKTGDAIHPKENRRERIDPYFGKHLIGGGHKSIEAPYIFYDRESDWYYLFVSMGWLSREGGYQIRMFRSRNVTGPYTDGNGKTFGRVPDHAPYGVKLMGAYTFPSFLTAYKSMGQNSVLVEDGCLYTAYHQRFANLTEEHEPRVHQLFRTADGWLTAAPFATCGERRENVRYTVPELSGAYTLVRHEPVITSIVARPIPVTLTPDGVLTENGQEVGSVHTLDDAGASVEYLGTKYQGCVIRMSDEAENPVTCITAVGSNFSIWMVRYDE